jgi:hypothetical protein
MLAVIQAESSACCVILRFYRTQKKTEIEVKASVLNTILIRTCMKTFKCHHCERAVSKCELWFTSQHLHRQQLERNNRPAISAFRYKNTHTQIIMMPLSLYTKSTLAASDAAAFARPTSVRKRCEWVRARAQNQQIVVFAGSWCDAAVAARDAARPIHALTM